MKEYLIKKMGQRKIILVIVMLSSTVLCAMGLVYLFENFDQSNWLIAAIWAFVIIFGARNVYSRYEFFKALDSMQTGLKAKNEQWFADILTQASKDCDLDKDKKLETGANHNQDGQSRKKKSYGIIETFMCLFWLSFCIFCCCQGEIILYTAAFFAGIVVLDSAWVVYLGYRWRIAGK